MNLTLSSTASPQDKWEFDRQQNIIDQIDGVSGTYAEESSEAKTATKRRAEALAVQHYLVKRNAESDAVNQAIDQQDADWVSDNPPPPAEEEPEPKED